MSKTRRLRWSILALLFAATSISYVHRQALSVVAPVLRDELSISNFGYARIVFAFLLSYTIMQAVTGWLIDRLGTRAGFGAIVGWWSAAAMLHAFGRDVFSFSVFRLLLGAGQAGSWAASVRAVAEWFPRQERGLANGIWGAGTSVGMIAAVPLVAWITLAAGWRWMFVLTGATGFIWLAAWLVVYRRNEDDAPAAAPRAPGLGAAEAPVEPGDEMSYGSLLRLRGVWALVLARVFADPIMWFYNAWVPEYLSRVASFSLADIGRYGWIPFFANGVGIVAGGMFSDRLCRRGTPVIRARLTSMLAGVILMTAGVLAAYPIHIAASIAVISVAAFGFGLWAPNMMSLCADGFPSHLVGSVTGLTGVGAGVGGMVFTLSTGWMLDHFGYAPVFVAAGTSPLLAYATLHVLLGADGLPLARERARR